MIKTYKVMLLPNNKQRTKMFEYANASRFAYNWAISRREEFYSNGCVISDGDLRKEFTKLRNTSEYDWLLNISSEVTKQSIKDACVAYKRFFNGFSNRPKYKSKKKSKPSFYQDGTKIEVYENKIKLALVSGKGKAHSKRNKNFCTIRLAEKGRIPINQKYLNPRITYDGVNWWISIGVDETFKNNFYNNIKNDGIGIDLGIKSLAICSDGYIYRNINKDKSIKRLEKRKYRLQRNISRKYSYNKKDGRYYKTCNIIKNEKLLLKINHKLSNIRNDYLHQVTSEITNRKPRFVCIEDLNVKGMVKNHHLAKSIQEQEFYKFRQFITYKCESKNIPLIIADRFYPSSKLCSCCGKIKKDLKLSDRIYKCECGNIIDRDLQAALNLKAYGEKFVK